MRLVRLVEDLNQLTSADAARAYLKRENVDLREFVERTLALNRHEFDARDITVHTTFKANAERVSADPDKLLQILRNLVQNAWQYTPEGGAFRIAATREGDAVRVEFANTVADLSPEDTDLLFERFHRLEKSRSRETGGAGIGLSIVKQLVEAHGGKVGVAVEDGEINFWITLPR